MKNRPPSQLKPGKCELQRLSRVLVAPENKDLGGRVVGREGNGAEHPHADGLAFLEV